MSANVYDGKALVNKLSRRIKRESERIRKQHHIDVGLGILLVTGNQVSMADTNRISSLARQLGINVHLEQVAQRNVARKFYPTLEEYASSPFIQGVYIPLPLPTDILPLAEVMRRLPPEKDVGGVHYMNRGTATYSPHETPERTHPPEVLAVAQALKECGFELRGGKVVLVGSDATAGLVKILAGYLFDHGCNVRLLRFSNISQVGSEGKTKRLHAVEEGEEKEDMIINPGGEAVITWANHACWLTRTRLVPHSIVIDVGYKFSRGRVSGDCDFQSVSVNAKAITPVPGGVRNITHVMILQNLMELINRQLGREMEKMGKGLRRKFSGP